MQPTVLSIAGSDPTGGAGIQADLKTMTSIGVYGAAVVTCITVQNSHGVSRVECMSPDLVFQQIKAVLDDQYVTHVKTGMVGTVSVAEAISGALADFRGEVICDPVMISSTGQPLMDSGTVQKFLEHFISKCTVLTPNLPELSRLTHTRITGLQDSVNAAEKLLKDYTRLRVVLVKGGHLETNNELVDSMVRKTGDTVHISSAPHGVIKTCNSHGTGCTFASAFASFHCLTGEDETSFRKSISYIQKLLRKSAVQQIIKNPKGLGGMLHYAINNLDP